MWSNFTIPGTGGMKVILIRYIILLFIDGFVKILTCTKYLSKLQDHQKERKLLITVLLKIIYVHTVLTYKKHSSTFCV
jgi:hypothetical protein